MHYAIIGLDHPGNTKRAELIESHREYMRNHPIKISTSGPLYDDDGETMVGSLIIVDVESRAEVEAFMANEPLKNAGVYATLEIRRWYQRVGAFAE